MSDTPNNTEVAVTPDVDVLVAADAVPVVRFADFGLAPEILRALTDQGYVHPTPIQAEAIPVVLQGRDVMGAARPAPARRPASRCRSSSC